MSLRKSPALTPALLAANRRNAQKSTGPRTADGKALSSLNRMKQGIRSREYLGFFWSLAYAEPCRVRAVAEAYVESRAVVHPLLRRMAEIAIQAENEVCAGFDAASDRLKKEHCFRRSKPECR